MTFRENWRMLQRSVRGVLRQPLRSRFDSNDFLDDIFLKILQKPL